MELQDYRLEFLDNVKAESAVNANYSELAFVSVFVEESEEEGILPDFVETPYRRTSQGKKRIKVNGYSENTLEQSLSIVVAEFSGKTELLTISKPDAFQAFQSARNFVEESINRRIFKDIDESDPAYDFARKIFIGCSEQTYRRIKIYLLTDMTLSKSAQNFLPEYLGDILVEYHVWDIQRLFNLVQGVSDKSEIIIKDFFDQNIPCIKVSQSDSFDSYLCSIPGQFLATIYDDRGNDLLEGNIRSFLSTKGAVNKAIRSTIVNEPDRFFMYNNGISATASSVVTTEDNGKMEIVSISDLQIVNGGQTTASLSNARVGNADLSHIFVSMKLTVVDKDSSKNIIPKIAECANTQNKVSAADFFSNKEYCIQIEKLSRRIFAPAQGGSQIDTHWFFERAKGQYFKETMNKKKSEIERFKAINPKKVSKTDWAKYRLSWEGKPYMVSRGAQTNFQYFAESIIKKYDSTKDNYHEEYFKETICYAILFKKIEELISIQPWYQRAYRAQIATYTLSLFSFILSRDYPNDYLNFQRIWKIQDVPTPIVAEFVNLTEVVNNEITAEDRDTANVTQWCKREECWKRMKARVSYRFRGDIHEWIIPKEDKIDVDKSSKKEKKRDDQVSDEIRVFNFGGVFWTDVADYCNHRKLLSSQDEISSLSIASKIPNKIPNPYQAKILVKLLKKAENDGYVIVTGKDDENEE